MVILSELSEISKHCTSNTARIERAFMLFI